MPINSALKTNTKQLWLSLLLVSSLASCGGGDEPAVVWLPRLLRLSLLRFL